MSIYNIGKIKKWLEKWGLVAFMLLVLSSFTLSSQDDRRTRQFRRDRSELALPVDSTLRPALSDSLRAVRDSIHRADSIKSVDSLSMLRKSSLESPAFTVAKDSIIEDFSNGKKMIYYYGDVSVEY